ncbi:hypothetical protein Tco_0469678 [Tanacetum coccineum]
MQVAQVRELILNKRFLMSQKLNLLSQGDSKDDDENDDNNDEDSENDDDGEEETKDDEYVRTPDYNVLTVEEEYDELYKDVNVRSKVAEQEEVGKGDAKMTDAARESGSNQSSSVSSDFASKFLILDNVSPANNEVASMLNVKARHKESTIQAPPLLSELVTTITENSNVAATTVPLTIHPFTPIPPQSTPTPAPTTESTSTLILALPDFSSLFGFDNRVSTLKKELVGYAVQTAFQSYTAEFEKEAKAEQDRFIDIIDKLVKDMIKEELKSQLP